jgi:hypothetical protein
MQHAKLACGTLRSCPRRENSERAEVRKKNDDGRISVRVDEKNVDEYKDGQGGGGENLTGK